MKSNNLKLSKILKLNELFDKKDNKKNTNNIKWHYKKPYTWVGEFSIEDQLIYLEFNKFNIEDQYPYYGVDINFEDADIWSVDFHLASSDYSLSFKHNAIKIFAMVAKGLRELIQTKPKLFMFELPSNKIEKRKSLYIQFSKKICQEYKYGCVFIKDKFVFFDKKVSNPAK